MRFPRHPTRPQGEGAREGLEMLDWLHEQGMRPARVYRVFVASAEEEPSEVLYVSTDGAPETALLWSDGSISVDAGW